MRRDRDEERDVVRRAAGSASLAQQI